MQSNYMQQLKETASFLKKECGQFPVFTMVLGSGLNPVAERLEVEKEIPYSEIPHCPRSTVVGHAGKLVIGKFAGQRIAVMQGRMHFYEGHKLEQVVFLFRAIGLAGAKVFFLTNASGSLHAKLGPGEMMLITDHLNLTGVNPLIGPNIEELGPRFPDMVDLYSQKLRACFEASAKSQSISLKQGVYVGLSGPSYETPAEVRMCHQLGGDAVGMSTVPEAIVLRHMGVRVVGLSCITNYAAGVSDQPANHEEVLETGRQVVEVFCKLLTGALQEMSKRNEI